MDKFNISENENELLKKRISMMEKEKMMIFKKYRDI